jgi:hypothetical protein
MQPDSSSKLTKKYYYGALFGLLEKHKGKIIIQKLKES